MNNLITDKLYCKIISKDNKEKVISIPLKDINFNLYEYLINDNLEFITMGLTISEAIGYNALKEYFKPERTFRLPLSKTSECYPYIIQFFDSIGIKEDSLSCNGCPDILIITDGKPLFIEIKYGRDKLRKDQLEWINKYATIDNYYTLWVMAKPLEVSQ